MSLSAPSQFPYWIIQFYWLRTKKNPYSCLTVWEAALWPHLHKSSQNILTVNVLSIQNIGNNKMKTEYDRSQVAVIYWELFSFVTFYESVCPPAW